MLLFLLFIRIPVIELAGNSTTYFIQEEEIVLGWIHSIEKEEWFETYKREKQNLVLTETHFKTYGAGTPYQAVETETEDGFIQMKMDLVYEKLNITVSENVQTTIFFDDREVPLYRYFDQYETVTIKTTNLPIWEYVRGEFL